MNKMQMAHEYALEMLKETLPTGSLYGDDASRVAMSIVESAWSLADAMQAEADERDKAEAEQKRKEVREILSDANTFIEREGQHFDDVNDCEVDWSQAPSDAAAYIKLSVWDIGAWIDELGGQIEDAPSFGLTGSHIVERPQ